MAEVLIIDARRTPRGVGKPGCGIAPGHPIGGLLIGSTERRGV